MIGIISDTHDNVGNVKRAVEIFRQRKVEFVIHLGDVVAPATIRFFNGVELRLLRGNCDGDIDNQKMVLKEIGGKHLGKVARFVNKGKRFAAAHGHDEAGLERLIRSGKYDYVLHGHTHAMKDKMIGKTRVINPGAHYWDSENTIALLDPAKDRLEFIELD